MANKGFSYNPFIYVKSDPQLDERSAFMQCYGRAHALVNALMLATADDNPHVRPTSHLDCEVIKYNTTKTAEGPWVAMAMIKQINWVNTHHHKFDDEVMDPAFD